MSGQLPPGTKLPPIRHLANDLGLARGTVNKVYDELARDGLVETAGRHGTVVLRRAATTTDLDSLTEAAEQLALVARQLGLDAAATHSALSRALDATG